MSSRGPWWYCHNCRAEVRTVNFMGSCPYCVLCRSACVEQVDNPADDPRMWLAAGENRGNSSAGQDVMQAHTPVAVDSLQPGRQTSHVGSTGPLLQGSSGFMLPRNGINATAGFLRPTVPTQSGTPTLFGHVGLSSPPDLRAMREANGVGMPRHGLARPQQPVDHQEQTMSPSARNGLLGDFRSGQEALHQLEASSQMTRDSSMPETDEIPARLPREELRAGSSQLGNLCAICQFSLDHQDSGEQAITTLPCSHSFHEPCIVTWLRGKMTCPVCRYQLVIQRGSNNTDEIFVEGGGNNNARLPGPPGAIGFERNAHHLSSSGEGHEGSSTGSLSTPMNSSPFAPGPSNSGFDKNAANNACENPQEHGHGGWEDDMDVD